jgi:Methyltransferase small domain
MAQVQPAQFPLNIGTPEEFALVSSALKNASFTEDTIYKTLNVEAMCDVGGIDFRTIDFSNVSDQFKLLFRLFFVQRPVPTVDVESVLDSETVHAFMALGLFGECDSANVYGRVLLYPVAGFLIASDRHTSPDGSPFEAPADIVFPAIYGGTLTFLRLLPKSAVAESLDLCAGSGIGAFVLSRFSKQAISADVTERATHFARFNCALNKLDNVKAVCGDLYSAVAGRTFDRITAHPPYVPSLRNTTIWRDGGVTGELLVRRIVEGLPTHLRAGGIACVVSLGLDTNEGQFEDRARGWLKDSAAEFDIIFASTNERTPGEILRDLNERDETVGPDQLQTLRNAFTEAGIVRMPYGALLIRRHTATDQHDAWALRTKLSEVTDGADFERAFSFHPYISDPEFVTRLTSSRPALAPRLQVRATHVVYEGALVPAEFIFETDKPFNALGRVDGWMVPLFARFNGSLTPEEIYAKAVQDDEIPEGFKLEDFTALIARMVERGFLTLPELAAHI